MCFSRDIWEFVKNGKVDGIGKTLLFKIKLRKAVINKSGVESKSGCSDKCDFFLGSEVERGRLSITWRAVIGDVLYAPIVYKRNRPWIQFSIRWGAQIILLVTPRYLKQFCLLIIVLLQLMLGVIFNVQIRILKDLFGEILKQIFSTHLFKV